MRCLFWVLRTSGEIYHNGLFTDEYTEPCDGCIYVEVLPTNLEYDYTARRRCKERPRVRKSQMERMVRKDEEHKEKTVFMRVRDGQLRGGKERNGH